MDSLTRLFVLCLGISLALGSDNGGTGNSQSVSCSQASSCAPDMTQIEDAVNNRRYQEACEIVTASDKCLQSAMDDCTAKGVSESIIQTLVNMQRSYKPHMKTLCEAAKSGGTLPVNASCFEIANCPFDQTEVQKALDEQNVAKACAMVVPSVQCLNSAFNDCKERKILPEDQLSAMSEQVKQAESVLEVTCGSGAGTIEPPGSPGENTDNGDPNVACTDANDKCVPNTEAIAEANSLEACKILISSQMCFKGAIRDCKARDVSDVDIPSIEEKQKALESQIEQTCQPITSGGVHCLLMQSCQPDDAENMNDYTKNKQYRKVCSMLMPFAKCQSAALDDCKSRDLLNSETMQEIQSSIEYANKEIERLNCTSGNSASISVPMLHVFLVPLWIFVMNCINSII